MVIMSTVTASALHAFFAYSTHVKALCLSDIERMKNCIELKLESSTKFIVVR